MARGPLAGVAGPGKFAVRTDGLTLPSAGYGEGVQTQAIKQGAPMEKAPNVPAATGTEVKQAASKGAPVTPLYAPSERPQEPVTTGIPLGAGAGPEVLGQNQTPAEDDTNFRANIQAYMPVLSYIASLPSTSPETRKAIRQLRDSL